MFALQQLLNLAWSLLFFWMRRPDLALIDIGLLLLAIGATVWKFWHHSKLAGWLLVPYLLWVAYATSLNAAIGYLNR